jgi:hypothetical protein
MTGQTLMDSVESELQGGQENGGVRENWGCMRLNNDPSECPRLHPRT